MNHVSSGGCSRRVGMGRPGPGMGHTEPCDVEPRYDAALGLFADPRKH